MGLGRWEKVKAKIDKIVIEVQEVKESPYELCTIQDRMADITESEPDWDLRVEIDDLRDKVNANPDYQDLMFKEKLLKANQDKRKVSENLVLEYMINNGILDIEVMDKKIVLANRKSVETILENIDEVPAEFVRVKKELDKVQVKKVWETMNKSSSFDFVTGELMRVEISGVKFVKNNNYSLKIKSL